jgi:DNA-binding transcriptional regulator YiaG
MSTESFWIIRKQINDTLWQVDPDQLSPSETSGSLKIVQLLTKTRKRLRLGQGPFSQKYWFTPTTFQSWEQWKRRPDAGLIPYMYLITKFPEIIDTLLWLAYSWEDVSQYEIKISKKIDE